MPTYDYVCIFCEYKFELFQQMTDKKLISCPECGQSTLKRLIGSGGAVIFYGDGFYCNESKKNNNKKPPDN